MLEVQILLLSKLTPYANTGGTNSCFLNQPLLEVGTNETVYKLRVVF